MIFLPPSVRPTGRWRPEGLRQTSYPGREQWTAWRCVSWSNWINRRRWSEVSAQVIRKDFGAQRGVRQALQSGVFQSKLLQPGPGLESSSRFWLIISYRKLDSWRWSVHQCLSSSVLSALALCCPCVGPCLSRGLCFASHRRPALLWDIPSMSGIWLE